MSASCKIPTANVTIKTFDQNFDTLTLWRNSKIIFRKNIYCNIATFIFHYLPSVPGSSL